MAEQTTSLFTKKASDKLRSPDDLDEYVRAINPSKWIVLAACVSLAVGLFAWGAYGTVETSIGASGTCVKGEVICFLPASKASSVHVGDVANVNGSLMEVSEMSAVPVSHEEARDIVGSDYLASTLVENDWTHVVRFKGANDQAFTEGIPLSITITTERIAPISLLFGGAA